MLNKVVGLSYWKKHIIASDYCVWEMLATDFLQLVQIYLKSQNFAGPTYLMSSPQDFVVFN